MDITHDLFIQILQFLSANDLRHLRQASKSTGQFLRDNASRLRKQRVGFRISPVTAATFRVRMRNIHTGFTGDNTIFVLIPSSNVALNFISFATPSWHVYVDITGDPNVGFQALLDICISLHLMSSEVSFAEDQEIPTASSSYLMQSPVTNLAVDLDLRLDSPRFISQFAQNLEVFQVRLPFANLAKNIDDSVFIAQNWGTFTCYERTSVTISGLRHFLAEWASGRRSVRHYVFGLVTGGLPLVKLIEGLGVKITSRPDKYLWTIWGYELQRHDGAMIFADFIDNASSFSEETIVIERVEDEN